MELVLLALCMAAGWGIVAKGEKTLRATRGGVGAARGVGRYVTGKGRAPVQAPAKEAAAKHGKGSSVKGRSRTGSTATRPQPTSVREAARMGWADGVQRALDKRAAGKDIVGRTRRAVRWSGDKAGRLYTGAQGIAAVRPEAKKRRAERQAKLDAAKAQHDTETQDPPAPAEDTDTKENGMTTNIAIGEMATLGDMKADTAKLSAAAQAHQETEAALKAAAGTFAERYQGADWGTEPINTAAAGVTESASGPSLNTNALVEALAATDAALKQAEAVTEVTAAEKASGRVENFAS